MSIFQSPIPDPPGYRPPFSAIVETVRRDRKLWFELHRHARELALQPMFDTRSRHLSQGVTAARASRQASKLDLAPEDYSAIVHEIGENPRIGRARASEIARKLGVTATIVSAIARTMVERIEA